MLLGEARDIYRGLGRRSQKVEGFWLTSGGSQRQAEYVDDTQYYLSSNLRDGVEILDHCLEMVEAWIRVTLTLWFGE